jgi:hypothetical protein
MVDYDLNKLKPKKTPAQFYSDIFEYIESKFKKFKPKPKWSEGQDWSKWERKGDTYLLCTSQGVKFSIWGPEAHQDPYTTLAYKSVDNAWGYFTAKSVASAKRIAERMQYEIVRDINRTSFCDTLNLEGWCVVDDVDLEFISDKGHKFQIRFAVDKGAVNVDVPLSLRITQNNLEIFTEVTTFQLPSLSCAIAVVNCILFELEHDHVADAVANVADQPL